MSKKKTLRQCERGHQYYKSSDCPTCPICEKEKTPESKFLSILAAPARRALENNGIKTVETLSQFTEKEVLSFHGIGKSSIPILRNALKEQGLSFKNQR